MLDLVVLKELKRKKRIPREWLLKDRKKEFVTPTKGGGGNPKGTLQRKRCKSI